MNSPHFSRIIVKTVVAFGKKVNGIDMIPFQCPGEFFRVKTGPDSWNMGRCVKIQMDLAVWQIVHNWIYYKLELRYFQTGSENSFEIQLAKKSKGKVQ